MVRRWDSVLRNFDLLDSLDNHEKIIASVIYASNQIYINVTDSEKAVRYNLYLTWLHMLSFQQLCNFNTIINQKGDMNETQVRSSLGHCFVHCFW